MARLAFILVALMMILSSCECFYKIDHYYIGGDYDFQHGVDNVVVNHTLGVCAVNFFDGRQRTFDIRKVAVDSTKGEIKINKVILYF